MSLVDVERAIARICFATEPDDADLAHAGGDPARWLLYRSMVRERLFETIRSALPRTSAAAGEELLRAAFYAHIAASPPRTRFLRETVPPFVSFLAARWREAPPATLPPFAVDLATLEGARWETSYVLVDPPSSLRELDLESPVVVNPTLRLLALSYAVHEKHGEADRTYEARATRLCVFRHLERHSVEVWAVQPFTADVVERLARREWSAKDAMSDVSRARGEALTAHRVERICGALADLAAAGALLGVSDRRS